MPYNRPYAGGFVDYPSTTTPINANALNTIDVGVKTANDQFQTVTTAQRTALTPTVGQAVWDSDLRQLMVFMNASGGNAWQPVGNTIVCTSTSRPLTPFEGQRIYETDTKQDLTYDGTSWTRTGFWFAQTVYFTGSGTFTKATYPWLRAIKIKCQAAGGGGGGSGTNNNYQGAGGGAGGYTEKFYTTISSLSASITVTVGAKGTGGAAGANDGTAGGDSSFGTIVVATGGSGGKNGNSTAGDTAGGGASTPGDFTVTGGAGQTRQITSTGYTTGYGGSSFMGAGAPVVSNLSSIAGPAANVGYGGGGGGGLRITGNAAGGNGADGIVIVELYA